ncbi:MAG: hypothetical protein OEV42_14550 [Deltaproteobacteria bacterium]|nr:hypothetical protein [Deltaproteobacteria bacterium]
MKPGAIFLFPLIIILLLLSACAATEEKKAPPPPAKIKVNAPDWILHYKNDRKICGIGISKPHIKGLPYQRLLAISRGIDEIARQLGVTVETKLETYMTGTSESVSTGLSSYSVQTSNGRTVEAEIEKAWINEETEEFFVLMCMDK